MKSQDIISDIKTYSARITEYNDLKESIKKDKKRLKILEKSILKYEKENSIPLDMSPNEVNWFDKNDIKSGNENIGKLDVYAWASTVWSETKIAENKPIFILSQKLLNNIIARIYVTLMSNYSSIDYGWELINHTYNQENALLFTFWNKCERDDLI